jgi:hypothetical protein
MDATTAGATSLSETLRRTGLADCPTLARRLAVGLLGVLFALALPTAAHANNLFTLDSQADTGGQIVTESSGTGYVAWDRPATNPATEPEVVLFCKIPRGGTCTDPINLPLPAGTFEEIVEPFPVLGSHPGVVYVVGPRYLKNDTLIWTSTDGGATFSSAKVGPSPGGYPDKTGVGDVLLDPNTPSSAGATEDYFGIAASNPGLGFGFTANEIVSGTTSFSFENPGAGGVASSTLGYATDTIEDSKTKKPVYPEVEAYYNLSNPVEIFFYRYYAKGGNVDGEEKGWEGPIKVSDGYVPRLAGGPAGLFLLSTDLASGEPLEAQPSAIDVRKYNEATHTFEAPTFIAKIPTSAGTLFNSGEIYENPATGALYVAQPVLDSEGNYVMRLWESTDGGQTFHGERNIATIGYAYSEIPRLAVAADGDGWLTFKDAGGLEVADLSALPAPAPTPSADTLATSQTSGTSSGASISITAGTIGETDHATLAGTSAAAATGTVTYGLYSNSTCTAVAFNGGTEPVTGGAAGSSAPVTAALAPGTYYWRAAYSGDARNDASVSACGSEVLTVIPAVVIEGAAPSSGTSVTITVSCPSAEPCTITVTVDATEITIVVKKASAARKKVVHKKTITLATGKFTIPGKSTKKLELKLTKAGKRLLKREHGHLKANVRISDKTPGGLELTMRTIAIHTVKPKHKK